MFLSTRNISKYAQVFWISKAMSVVWYKEQFRIASSMQVFWISKAMSVVWYKEQFRIDSSMIIGFSEKTW